MVHSLQNIKRGLIRFREAGSHVTCFPISFFCILSLCAGKPMAIYSQQNPVPAEVKQTKPLRYYGHEAVLDRYGVISPWYTRLNGQCDYRIRVAAETLKRYPWTTTQNAIIAAPDYLFTSNWEISAEGNITPKDFGDWSNGDLGQRSTSVLKGMVDYYRYSGDPAALAHMTYMGNYLLDYCLTPSDHLWPEFPISVPTKGKAYWLANPEGMIQLDISAGMGEALLRGYQVTKNHRWLDAAKHWGDLFADKCNTDPNSAPWTRYAVPVEDRYKGDPRGNVQTGGVTMILSFLDELIRMGYTGKNDQLVSAREAGIRYLKDKLLPQWTSDQTWGFFFWDWINDTQNCSTTADVAAYMIRHRDDFPNWRTDARNILTLFLNHSSADPKSGGDVYNGAWAYPESSSCCGRSLWYAPLMVGSVMAQYGVAADDPLMQEMAYRQMILQTYDVHETGVSEDNIDGGVIVNSGWLNIAHPWPLLWVQQAIGWLPEQLGANRENHLVRTNAVVDTIIYNKGVIKYSTFNSPQETTDVFRMSFVPSEITADGDRLSKLSSIKTNGYTVKKLPNGDAIVTIRHDGKRRIVIQGSDPQTEITHDGLKYKGPWTIEKDSSSKSGIVHLSETKDASATLKFMGNQVRLSGRADQFGGQADVYIDGIKQSVYIDFWNPSPRGQQTLYYKNGLAPGDHTLKIVVRGAGNPYSKGSRINIDAIRFSSAAGISSFPTGTGPNGTQRMIFGYAKRADYKDSQGNLWRPATEVVSHLSNHADNVARCWMAETKHNLANTSDAEIYRYGYHASDFHVNITVGPGKYDVRLKFAAARDTLQSPNGFDIIINDKLMVHKLDVVAAAKGSDRGVDLLFRSIVPLNGIIQVRFKGATIQKGDSTVLGEAFVQALEVGPKLKGKGAEPVSLAW